MTPIPMVLFCPYCHFEHIDLGEWVIKVHRTHLCSHCRSEFRPSNLPTVGVKELPTEDMIVGSPYYVVEDRFFRVSFASNAMYEILHKPRGCIYLNPKIINEARGWIRESIEKFLKQYKHDPTDEISLVQRVDWIMKPLMIDAVKMSAK